MVRARHAASTAASAAAMSGPAPTVRAREITAAPASWTSLWAFADNIVESGAPYCVEGMNIVDYMVEEKDIASAMAVGYPGDYGGDAAAGVVSVAAELLRCRTWSRSPARSASRTASAKASCWARTVGCSGASA